MTRNALYWTFTPDGMILSLDSTHGFDWVHATTFDKLKASHDELLASLKEAVEVMRYFDHDPDEGEGDPIGPWKEAIAKAEGLKGSNGSSTRLSPAKAGATNKGGRMTHESKLTKSQKRDFVKYYVENGVKMRIKAQVRYDDECGNGHNTFSITG